MFRLRIFRHKIWMTLIKLTAKVISIPKPIVHVGPGSTVRLANVIGQAKDANVLLVTDNDLVQLGLHESSLKALDSTRTTVTVFSDISPNPTVEQVEHGLQVARDNQCNVILAIGGGSPIDAAKMIATCLTNNKPIEKLAGLFKVRKALIPLYVVPTTAGTGTEASFGAVVTNKAERRKFSVADPKLVPLATALDSDLMLGLPKSVTAMTGLDALTHAIETYISTLAGEASKHYSSIAVRLIFDNLVTAYSNGSDATARENMSLAAFYAGLAINEAGLGYVHAIAHQLGGLYGVPHGLANAVVLPHVLDFSLSSVTHELAELNQLVDSSPSNLSLADQAQAFIDSVRGLIQDLDIPETLEHIKTEDHSEIAQRAVKEAFDFYGVPKYMNVDECKEVVRRVSS